MGEPQIVQHFNVNGRYRIVIERAASTKGVLGFKAEANGDDIIQIVQDIERLKKEAERIAQQEGKDENDNGFQM